ncbi:MAG: hypothetical protein QXS81_05485 [Candidatus Micrarchaeaceae archaeon]
MVKKIKASDLVFKGLSPVNDMKALRKLVERYTHAKTKNNAKEMEKCKAEISKLIPNMEESLSRIIAIYSSAVDELAKSNDQDSKLYTEEQSKSYLRLLYEIKAEMEKIKTELGV